MMETYNVFLVFVIAVLALSPPVQPTRIRSSWSYNQGTRLNYLTKFGVQKGHQVFAYGGSLRKSSSSSHYGYDETLVLAFVPSSTWDKFYHLESDDRRDCQRFMAPFNGSLSSDDRCYRQGNDTADLYRVVPCDHQETCRNQHNIPLVHGSNFTFRIVSPSTQYYYLFLVACIQNNGSQPCEWFASGSVAIDFNVHIVNQDPSFPPNPFTYEFSYNLIGMMILYIIFSCIYFTVLFFHLLMHSCICTPANYKHHRLTLMFTVSLALETFHVLLVMAHYCVFSEDGVGLRPLLYMGRGLNFISDWLLILVLILLGKGWQITTATVRWKKTTLVVWIVYIVVSGIFFSWIFVSGSSYVHTLANKQACLYSLPEIAFKLLCNGSFCSQICFVFACMLLMRGFSFFSRHRYRSWCFRSQHSQGISTRPGLAGSIWHTASSYSSTSCGR